MKLWGELHNLYVINYTILTPRARRVRLKRTSPVPARGLTKGKRGFFQKQTPHLRNIKRSPFDEGQRFQEKTRNYDLFTIKNV
jgi:hypothetical protein